MVSDIVKSINKKYSKPQQFSVLKLFKKIEVLSIFQIVRIYGERLHTERDFQP